MLLPSLQSLPHHFGTFYCLSETGHFNQERLVTTFQKWRLVEDLGNWLDNTVFNTARRSDKLCMLLLTSQQPQHLVLSPCPLRFLYMRHFFFPVDTLSPKLRNSVLEWFQGMFSSYDIFSFLPCLDWRVFMTTFGIYDMRALIELRNVSHTYR